MTTEERRERMVTEACYRIRDPHIRTFVEEVLTNDVPAYFYTIPASVTKKYHPTKCIGEGGLVEHTIMALSVADALLPAFPELGPHRDYIYAALALHDTVKLGPTATADATTSPNHPMFPRKLYARHRGTTVKAKKYDTIMSLIEEHMGIWGPITPKRRPCVRITTATFVHLCDLIASRREFEHVFSKG